MWLETHIRGKWTTLSRTNWSFSLTLSSIAHLKSHSRTRFFWVGGRRLGKFPDFLYRKSCIKFSKIFKNFHDFRPLFFKFKKSIEFILNIYFYTEKFPRSFFTLAENFFIKRSRPENLVRCWIFFKVRKYENDHSFSKAQKYMGYLGKRGMFRKNSSGFVTF